VKLERNLRSLEKSAKIKIGGDAGNSKEVFFVMLKIMSIKQAVIIKNGNVKFPSYTGDNRISTQS
jgi:hypothetical protein